MWMQIFDDIIAGSTELDQERGMGVGRGGGGEPNDGRDNWGSNMVMSRAQSQKVRSIPTQA